MDMFLYLIVPALLLLYFLKALPSSARDYNLVRGMLVAGTLFFYVGILLPFSPGAKSVIKLAGACMFFTGVAFHSMKRPGTEPPESAESTEEDDSPKGES